MEQIKHYFNELSELQIRQFEQLYPLYLDWNSKINVISRKDFEHLYEHHILHALAIAKVIQFKPGSEILDLGTGGGFPGIPLAIMFPEVKFTLVDSIGKKIKVVQEIAAALGLKNVTGIQSRVEELKKQKFDFVVSRAVAPISELLRWTRKMIKVKPNHGLPNGWLLLKGGNLKEEIKAVSKHEYIEKYPIGKYFKESFFEEKYVLYVQG
ncbi:MAG: 16S rRNA (guanine(527)-N(7))-methyltransferase RsmG [Saprospiraceae bacterium]